MKLQVYLVKNQVCMWDFFSDFVILFNHFYWLSFAKTVKSWLRAKRTSQFFRRTPFKGLTRSHVRTYVPENHKIYCNGNQETNLNCALIMWQQQQNCSLWSWHDDNCLFFHWPIWCDKKPMHFWKLKKNEVWASSLFSLLLLSKLLVMKRRVQMTGKRATQRFHTV